MIKRAIIIALLCVGSAVASPGYIFVSARDADNVVMVVSYGYTTNDTSTVVPYSGQTWWAIPNDNFTTDVTTTAPDVPNYEVSPPDSVVLRSYEALAADQAAHATPVTMLSDSGFVLGPADDPTARVTVTVRNTNDLHVEGSISSNVTADYGNQLTVTNPSTSTYAFAGFYADPGTNDGHSFQMYHTGQNAPLADFSGGNWAALVSFLATGTVIGATDGPVYLCAGGVDVAHVRQVWEASGNTTVSGILSSPSGIYSSRYDSNLYGEGTHIQISRGDVAFGGANSFGFDAGDETAFLCLGDDAGGSKFHIQNSSGLNKIEMDSLGNITSVTLNAPLANIDTITGPTTVTNSLRVNGPIASDAGGSASSLYSVGSGGTQVALDNVTQGGPMSTIWYPNGVIYNTLNDHAGASMLRVRSDADTNQIELDSLGLIHSPLTAGCVPYMVTSTGSAHGSHFVTTSGFAFDGTNFKSPDVTLGGLTVNTTNTTAGIQKGTATLVGGTVTVTGLTITANSVVQMTQDTAGGTAGVRLQCRTAARTNGAGSGSIVLESVSALGVVVATDTSSIGWVVFN